MLLGITDINQIEHIVGRFENTVVKNINDEFKTLNDDAVFQKSGQSLYRCFGDYWSNGMLEDQTKKDLVTAKTMFDLLSCSKNTFDYSGVCIMAIKAMEREFQKRFFSLFLSYIEDEDPELAYEKFPLGLRKTNNIEGTEYSIKKEEDFTLGALVMLFSNVNYGDERKKEIKNDKQNGYEWLRDYCKNRLFNEKHLKYSDIDGYIKKCYQNINDLNLYYRIPSAHVSRAVTVLDAEKCLNKILSENGLLVELLNYCKE